MKNYLQKLPLLTFLLLLTIYSNTARSQNQVVIKGKVTDKTNGQPMPGISVSIKGAAAGAVTDANGGFRITTSRSLPLTLVLTSVGYKAEEVTVSSADADVNVALTSTSILGQEVVVSASRVSESIMESPVSIEKLNTKAIRESPSMSFYDGLTKIKGVESSQQSFTFNSLTTRGFNANGNTRFNQFIDGMDNQAPGLNFAVGNVVGINELDVESVELLPGASSALYGAGGTNGTLLMNSKNPFDYQGLSFQLKGGINHVNDKQASTGFIPDIAARYAKAFGKFAFKVNVAYLRADDWRAADSSNIDRLNLVKKPGTSHADDPNYDGINSYGDEINANMRSVANSVIGQATQQFVANYTQQSGGVAPTQTQINNFLASNATTQPFYLGLAGGLIPDQTVSRTGYKESDVVDYSVKSLRLNAALHYRFTDNLELILHGNWGKGTSVYTGSDRYSLRNFTLGQYKVELKGKNFFLRGYTTQENSGDAYNATALSSLLNESWKPSTTWFPQYVGNYVAARGQNMSEAQAHAFARSQANVGRFQPGSDAFNKAKDSLTQRYIGFAADRGGAKFNDQTNLWHYEGMYNFSELVKVLDVQVGANYRRYALHSNGTIFDDATRDIKIDEYGGFLQLGKKLVNDRIKLTGSIRYDKNENFEGRFTPRISGVFTVAPENNIRLSYQTGFRNPTTQNQYIDLLVRANTYLIGGLPELINKYDLNTNKGYTQASVQKFAQTGNPADLQQYTFGKFKPERVNAYEIGYRGLIKKRLLIDAYYYYNTYHDFVSTLVVLQTPDGQPFGLATNNYKAISTVVNNTEKVNTQGWALGLDYVVKTWTLSGNVSYNKISDETEGLYSDYNTPEYRFNVGVANSNVYKNFGFNVNYRWQDAYYWTSTFAYGDVPAFGTIDAQINYKIPQAKAIIKLGASNLLNHYYITSYGNPSIGGVYYAAITFDGLFR